MIGTVANEIINIGPIMDFEVIENQNLSTTEVVTIGPSLREESWTLPTRMGLRSSPIPLQLPTTGRLNIIRNTIPCQRIKCLHFPLPLQRICTLPSLDAAEVPVVFASYDATFVGRVIYEKVCF